MDILNREGPQMMIFNSERCTGCKFHHNVLMKTGRNPVRWYYCQHPKILDTNKEYPPHWPLTKRSEGELIGETTEVPTWCPVNRKSQETVEVEPSASSNK